MSYAALQDRFVEGKTVAAVLRGEVYTDQGTMAPTVDGLEFSDGSKILFGTIEGDGEYGTSVLYIKPPLKGNAQ